MDLGLSGATAIVCGGTQGMGRATARCLAEDGARVAVLGRDRGRLDETVKDLLAAGAADAVGLSADLSDPTAVDAAFAVLGERWGALNILVNAAGPAQGHAAFEEWSDADWTAAFDGLALGYVRTIRAALPLLRAAEWARIVNISAHSTKRQTVRIAPYTAAKAAVTSLTKNLAKSLAPEGILVNTVSPGTIMSEQIVDGMRERLAAQGRDSSDPEDVMDFITEVHDVPAQLGRAGLPDEVGTVVALLASRRNGYTTGADVNVDGGSDFC
jgi:NAD(P)-dependent dehydrogenase (short-subunit alcohol dehydrogenase family)